GTPWSVRARSEEGEANAFGYRFENDLDRKVEIEPRKLEPAHAAHDPHTFLHLDDDDRVGNGLGEVAHERLMGNRPGVEPAAPARDFPGPSVRPAFCTSEAWQVSPRAALGTALEAELLAVAMLPELADQGVVRRRQRALRRPFRILNSAGPAENGPQPPAESPLPGAGMG